LWVVFKKYEDWRKTKRIPSNQLEERMQLFYVTLPMAFSNTRIAFDGTRTNVSIWKIRIISSLFRRDASELGQQMPCSAQNFTVEPIRYFVARAPLFPYSFIAAGTFSASIVGAGL